MEPSSIFVDFNNADTDGRIRLNVNGALRDIKAKNIIMKAGLELLLDDEDEFKTKGIVEFSKEENIWVARINWSDLEER